MAMGILLGHGDDIFVSSHLVVYVFSSLSAGADISVSGG